MDIETRNFIWGLILFIMGFFGVAFLKFETLLSVQALRILAALLLMIYGIHKIHRTL